MTSRRPSRKRLDVYQTQTAPLVEYYRGHSILKEVDGDRPVDEVYADVRALLAVADSYQEARADRTDEGRRGSVQGGPFVVPGRWFVPALPLVR